MTSIRIFYFYLANFLVSFISDIILHDLSDLNIIPELQDYFQNKLIVQAGIYAGLTIILALIISHFIYYLIMKQDIEEFISIFLIISFVVGYIIDWIIYWLKPFGNTLDRFYKGYSVGVLGGISLIFTEVVSGILIYKIKN